MRLSTAQKILKFFTSASRFEKMTHESKLYRFDCACGQTTSIWDIGGIRYKSYGKPKSLVKCPHCEKIAMRTIYKAEKQKKPTSPG